MPAHPTGADLDAAAQAAVVFELLDRRPGFTKTHLYAAVKDVSSERLDAAVSSLETVGLLTDAPAGLAATPALVRLDQLGLIHV